MSLPVVGPGQLQAEPQRLWTLCRRNDAQGTHELQGVPHLRRIMMARRQHAHLVCSQFRRQSGRFSLFINRHIPRHQAMGAINHLGQSQ